MLLLTFSEKIIQSLVSGVCASPVFLHLCFSNCTASFIVGAEIVFEIVIATFKKYHRTGVPRVSIIAVALVSYQCFMT